MQVYYDIVFPQQQYVIAELGEYLDSTKRRSLQSSCHWAFAEDALNAKVMNLQAGGVQPQMCNMMWVEKM